MESRDWSLALDEPFDGSSLDEDRWGIGFGWGTDCDNDDATVSEDNVVVDDALRLKITHGGGGTSDVRQGAINTRDRQTFGPGHYFEARMKLPARQGVLPAFWAKPNSDLWPPELDFIELFQDSDADLTQAHYNVHYANQVGDAASHSQSPVVHNAAQPLTESFNVFGCAWLEDSISFYFNGEHVGACETADALATTNGAAPFYLMFSNHVNRIGSADLSQPWEEETVVDWCRVWEPSA
ncbi:glycoside hydrolase family 16 protein [Natrinema versiforme]|uniref:glycoside hydrolase family 16 protein n=1 Tax=Natrinema versiforme TaxID=88724 RepID=UPI00067811DD|nr:glycoside hydrolase family 16 protein [Natrinema versiforme]